MVVLETVNVEATPFIAAWGDYNQETSLPSFVTTVCRFESAAAPTERCRCWE